MFSFCGCVWVQIHTKLQERLIQGLFFSIIYCAFYVTTFYVLIEHYEETCNSYADHGDSMQHTKNCVLELVEKCVSSIVLACYIPALAICLYHIDRLDAVMETIETIWEMEGIQRAVRGFNQHMEKVADQVLLLQAIEDRVMTRTNLVLRFGRRVIVLTQKTPAERSSLLKAATRGVVDFLLKAKEELGSPDEWWNMDSHQQKIHVRRIQAMTEEMSQNSFSPTYAPEQPAGSFTQVELQTIRGSGEKDHLYDTSRSRDEEYMLGTSTNTMPSGTFQEGSEEP